MGHGTAEIDYRRSELGRRRSWYGTKRHVKRVLGWRLPNLVMRGALRFAPHLRETGRLPVPASLTEVVGRVNGAEYRMVRPAECVVAKELYWGGGRRPQAADDFALRLFAAAARSATAMFDVGAYTGLFTLAGTSVNPRLKAHAFEIVPEVYHALFDNCVRNRLLTRVTLHPAGVGDPESVISMPAESGDSALPCFYSSELNFADGVPVPVYALDSLTDRVETGGGEARVVMKVDVEGTEAAVFEHGQRFLARHRPDILCEVLPHADAERLSALLEPHGYRFHLVRDHDLAPAGPLEPDARYRDWFFTTRKAEEFTGLGIPVGDV